jgi:hypothetical protein
MSVGGGAEQPPELGKWSQDAFLIHLLLIDGHKDGIWGGEGRL